MEQQAQVIRIVNENIARVAVKRKSACSGDCHTCHGCPHPDEIVMVDADNLVGAQKGDDVIVRSDTGRVLKLAAMLYLMPMILFFVGYFTMPGGEGARIACGAAAFVVGILICMYVSRSMKKNNKEMHFSIVQVLGE
ncbi:MAG: SoxR reducing system RseC family protein [Clostridia bacterium]|nr:SoxR reducing system RseC family protein [Clostridia bacterium]